MLFLTKVVFTNVELSASNKKKLALMGAVFVEDVRLATHLVASAVTEKVCGCNDERLTRTRNTHTAMCTHLTS